MGIFESHEAEGRATSSVMGPVRRFIWLIGALSILFVPSACAGTTDPVMVPGTSFSLDEALFLPSQSKKIPLGAAAQGRLCGDLQITESKLSHSAITLANNDLLLLARTGHCGIEIVEEIPNNAVNTISATKGNGCSFGLKIEDDKIDKIYVSGEPYNSLIVTDCVTRAGLFISGLQGALHLKNDELIVSRAESYLAYETSLPERISLLYIIIRMCGVDPAAITTRDQIPTKLNCAVKK